MVTVTDKRIMCPACGAPAGKACVSIKSGKPLADMHAARRLISLKEAAREGHLLLCKPQWANPLDHIKISSHQGALGPWVRLYSPVNKKMNGRDPVELLAGIDPLIPKESLDSPEFGIYTGPTADSEEYASAREQADA